MRAALCAVAAANSLCLAPAGRCSSLSSSNDITAESPSAGPPAEDGAAAPAPGPAPAPSAASAASSAVQSQAERVLRQWQSVRHVNGVAVYAEEEGPDGDGGALMVSAVVRSSPQECFDVSCRHRPMSSCAGWACSRAWAAGLGPLFVCPPHGQ